MKRFAFGENWRKFSEQLQAQDYFAAKKSLEELLPNLRNKTFLDVGCGSGLFSIAAGALGASKVLGFDIDEESIVTSKRLLEKVSQWDTNVRKNAIEFKVGSVFNEDMGCQRYDVVYSWGVLHHTGDMYKAFAAVCRMVEKNGILVIAIYNKYFTSPLWKAIKYAYVKSPNFVKRFIIFLALIRYAAVALIISGKVPLRGARGMHFYTDVVDWVGGYPYEYASVSEVAGFFEKKGFKLKTVIKTQSKLGNNQFVFERMV
jgi:2-polyprenyl-6-hydroxyphenyl methylase/3-demethylubiquinone-9 3-methyltransferase